MQFLKIGVATKPHGIKGELRVYPVADNPAWFGKLVGESVYVGEKMQSYRLQGWRLAKGMVYAKLCGIGDRDAAAKLAGAGIFIDESKARPLDEDEYFEKDIVGMEVFCESGARLGYIEKVLYSPANDVYVVKPLEGKSFMLPAVKEVVLQVSVADKRMTVRLIEGLRELGA